MRQFVPYLTLAIALLALLSGAVAGGVALVVASLLFQVLAAAQLPRLALVGTIALAVVTAGVLLRG